MPLPTRDQGRVESCQRGCDRMLRVRPVDHVGDLADRVPDGRIAVLQVQLVARHPHQHGGMILVQLHFPADTRQLVRHRVGVVVVEAVAFARHVDAHGHHQSVAAGAIQHRKHLPVVCAGAPGAERIAAACRQFLLAAVGQARALHVERLAIDLQPVSVRPMDDTDMGGAAGCHAHYCGQDQPRHLHAGNLGRATPSGLSSSK